VGSMKPDARPVREPTDPRVARSRQKVLAAAVDLVRDRGVADLTVEAVITQSGVARSTIYRHWPTRADLVQETLETLVPGPGGTAEMPSVDEAADAAQVLSSTAVRLHVALATFVGSPGERTPAGLVPMLLVEADRDPELVGLRDRLVQRLVHPVIEALRPARSAGLVHEMSAEDAVAWLLGPLLVRRFLTSEGLDRHFLDATVAAFMRAHTDTSGALATAESR